MDGVAEAVFCAVVAIGFVDGVGLAVAVGVAPGFVVPALVVDATGDGSLPAELVLEGTALPLGARFAFRFTEVFAFFDALDEFEEFGLLAFAFRSRVESGVDRGRVVSRPMGG